MTSKYGPILIPAIGVLSVLLLGTLGYSIIEGWSSFDAFYMTVITISTVGFQEVHPLSDAGRILSIVLIFSGVGLVMLVFINVSQRILERQIAWFSEKRMVRKKIDALSGHTIFCGYGRLSRIAIADLVKEGLSPVVIDSNEEAIAQAEAMGLLTLRGDATQEETLVDAGIKKAGRLVSLLPKDADNLYVVLTSRELNPNIYTLSRAENESGEKRLLKAGATKVLSPYRVGGQKIADGLLRPYVADFLDLAVAGTRGGELQIEEIEVPENSPVIGKTLFDSGLKNLEQLIIVALIDGNTGKMTFNPSRQVSIAAGSHIIVMGLKEDLNALNGMLLR